MMYKEDLVDLTHLDRNIGICKMALQIFLDPHKDLLMVNTPDSCHQWDPILRYSQFAQETLFAWKRHVHPRTIVWPKKRQN